MPPPFNRHTSIKRVICGKMDSSFSIMTTQASSLKNHSLIPKKVNSFISSPESPHKLRCPPRPLSPEVKWPGHEQVQRLRMSGALQHFLTSTEVIWTNWPTATRWLICSWTHILNTYSLHFSTKKKLCPIMLVLKYEELLTLCGKLHHTVSNISLQQHSILCVDMTYCTQQYSCMEMKFGMQMTSKISLL